MLNREKVSAYDGRAVNVSYRHTRVPQQRSVHSSSFLSLNRAEHEERPFKRRLDEVLSNIKLREAAKCLSTGTVAFLMSKQTEVDPIQASDK